MTDRIQATALQVDETKERNGEEHSSNISQQRPKSLILQAFTAGTVASSCCLFQLGLNLLSTLNIIHVGCAGFNTFLGPLRPLTRSLTLAWLVKKWMDHILFTNVQSPTSMSCSGLSAGAAAGKAGKLKGKGSECKSAKPENSYSQENCCTSISSPRKDGNSRKKLFFASVLCVFLMFMPELLEYFGNRHFEGFANSADDSKENYQSEILRMEYVVDNMGCEACIHAVEKLINGQDGVIRSKVVSFDSGEVEIFVSGKEWNGVTASAAADMASKVLSSRQETFERKLNEVLQQHGYELHPKGWVTKKMKLLGEEGDRGRAFFI